MVKLYFIGCAESLFNCFKMLAMKKLCKIFVSGLILLFFQQVCFAQEWQYEVKKGDSLWTIADRYLIHDSYVRRLQKYNNLANPLVLQPGQIIKAPVEWLGNLPGSAKVQSVSGSVEVINNNNKTDIDIDYELKANDRLITSDNGSIQIQFSDKSTLKVFSNTSLVFKTIKQSHDGSVINVRIDVEQGRVNVNVNPNKDPGHRLEIESPSAVTAVRGTEFRIGVDAESDDTVAEVLQGRITVSAVGQAVAVEKLFGTKAEKGSRPMRPVKLLQGPQVAPLPIIETKVVALNWQALEGAKNYRVRVSTKEDFSDIFYDELVTANQADDIFFAEDGEFYASVRAVDKNDIEGIDSVFNFKVNARPEPPLIISPKENETNFNLLPEFAWTTPAEGVEKLRFQLTKQPDFSKIIVDQTFVSRDGFEMQNPLAEGRYFWRIANIDSDGQGPYSKAFTFIIKPQPEIATELVDSESGSQVSLNFSKDPSVSRYRVQVARDADFDKLLFDDWVDGEKFAFDTEGAGSYYIRLGVEDKATDTINYADAQKVIVPFKEWGRVLISLITGLLIAL